MPGNSKIDALTGVRALAALWVVSLHYNGEFTALLPFLRQVEWITGRGYYGVDIFFILSGFILSYTYQEAIREMDWRSYFRFVWFRFARIYPAYLVALLVAIFVLVLAIFLKLPWNRESYQPLQLLYEFFMVHQWTFRENHPWNYPDWSVSSEWFAYLFVFPLTYVLLKRLKRIWPAALLMLASLGVYAFTPIGEPAAGSWGLYQVAMEFMAGAVLYRIFTLAPVVSAGWQNMLSTAVVAVMMVVLWLGLYSGILRLFFLLSIAALLFLLGCRGGFLPALLGNAFFVYLGEISYSIYLTHGVDQRILKDILPVNHFADHSFFHRLGFFAIYVAMIIGGAALLYHLVEVPARSFMRRWIAPEVRLAANVPVSDHQKTR